MRILRYGVFFVWLLLPGYGAAQQVAARVPGLEGNAEYMELLQREAGLRSREDSILRVTDEVRGRFRLDPGNRQQFGAELLRLEQEVFDVRNQLGILTGRISRIEQEWVVASLNRQTDYTQPVPHPTPDAPRDTLAVRPAVPAPKADPASLSAHELFRERLKPADYAALRQAESREQSVANYFSIYRTNYRNLQRLAADYLSAAAAPAADSIYARYGTVAALNDRIADSLTAIWGRIRDDKSYSYSYLFDHLNRGDLLAAFDRRMQQTRQDGARDKGRFMHDVAGFYPREKEALLDCEIELAEMLDLEAVRDSLREAKRRVDPRDFDFGKIVLERRYFFDYDSIKILPRTRYTAQNPIPQTQLFPRGEVYRIALGTYTQAQQPSVFRNAWPLSYLKLDDGRYRYFAGGYRTRQEAEGAVAMLKRAGFRRPEVVVWQDGVYRNLADEAAAAPAVPATATKPGAAAARYRIEITGGGGDLPDAARAVISELAPGKDLARVSVPAPDGGPAAFVFLLGSFDDQAAAQQIAEAIGQHAPTLTAKVAELK